MHDHHHEGKPVVKTKNMVLCFFKNQDGSIDQELLEFHPILEYHESGKKYERGFVYSQVHGVQNIDTGLIPKVSTVRAEKFINEVKLTSIVNELSNQLQIEE